MRRGVRLSAVTLTLVLIASMPVAALADELRTDDGGAVGSGGGAAGTDVAIVDKARDASGDEAHETLTDRVSDLADDARVADRKPRDPVITDRTDLRPVTDVRPDARIDREVDRLTDRCHPRIVDNVRRCLHDHWPHDLDIRHLIWRLIKAHEWEKLIRLLHWLGWL